MDKPLVSICSITYNHAPYIRQCMDGFLMQKTNFPFEIIINDDCSTDGTTEIIKEYAAKYPDLIKPIFHDENQYQKGVRGIFVKFVFPKAQGKYLALCEGDDYWIDPLKLQKQVDFLETHLDYSMCFHRAKIENEINKPNVFIHCSMIEDRDYTGDELFRTWTVPTASMIFRREVLNYKNITDKRILYGDIILILRCAEFGKIKGMSSEMSVYRIQQNSATNNPTLNKNRIEATPSFLDFIRENFSCVKNETLRKLYSDSYFEIFKLNKNCNALWKSVKKSPLNVICRIFNWAIRSKLRK